jgi:hypothetical protein
LSQLEHFGRIPGSGIEVALGDVAFGAYIEKVESGTNICDITGKDFVYESNGLIMTAVPGSIAGGTQNRGYIFGTAIRHQNPLNRQQVGNIFVPSLMLYPDILPVKLAVICVI